MRITKARLKEIIKEEIQKFKEQQETSALDFYIQNERQFYQLADDVGDAGLRGSDIFNILLGKLDDEAEVVKGELSRISEDVGSGAKKNRADSRTAADKAPPEGNLK